jgi:6-pyruvoyltetrahydropterin 2'-reductase
MQTNVENDQRPMLKVSEIFYSIQGEGPYTGHPMVFVRTFGCNFQCAGFSNPNNESPDSGSLSGIQPIIGCDSLYSWHSSYKKTVDLYRPSELYMEMLNKLPNKEWINKETYIRPILCFTGGEPTLHQVAIGSFIQDLVDAHDETIETILFETNCAVDLTVEFRNILADWLHSSIDRKLVWANSPKLSNSGEEQSKAIRPDVFVKQVPYINGKKTSSRSEQYLKFVSDGSDESFEEIREATTSYREATWEASPFEYYRPNKVFVMPEGATLNQQNEKQTLVAEQCLKHGYMYCARVHVSLWNNTKGT